MWYLCVCVCVITTDQKFSPRGQNLSPGFTTSFKLKFLPFWNRKFVPILKQTTKNKETNKILQTLHEPYLPWTTILPHPSLSSCFSEVTRFTFSTFFILHYSSISCHLTSSILKTAIEQVTDVLVAKPNELLLFLFYGPHWITLATMVLETLLHALPPFPLDSSCTSLHPTRSSFSSFAFVRGA